MTIRVTQRFHTLTTKYGAAPDYLGKLKTGFCPVRLN